MLGAQGYAFCFSKRSHRSIKTHALSDREIIMTSSTFLNTPLRATYQQVSSQKNPCKYFHQKLSQIVDPNIYIYIYMYTTLLAALHSHSLWTILGALLGMTHYLIRSVCPNACPNKGKKGLHLDHNE